MCGLFAFLGTQPDRGTLQQVIRGAAARGPHGWGTFWISESGTPHHRREHGSLMSRVQDAASDLLLAPVIVGQARLATTGTQSRYDLEDYQPLVTWRADGCATVVAHNGTVADPASLQNGYQLHTGNDSEVLLHLWKDDSWLMPLLYKLGDAPQAAILLDMQRGTLHAATKGHPLHLLSRPEGFYVCSRPIEDSMPIYGEWRGSY